MEETAPRKNIGSKSEDETRRETGHLSGYPLLRGTIRHELVDGLKKGAPLGLLWVGLESFALFESLYGPETGTMLVSELGRVLGDLVGDILPRNKVCHLVPVERAAYVVLFQNGPLSLAVLRESAIRLRLTLRTRLNQEIVRLTGQTMGVSVGHALVAAGAEKDLEGRIFSAVTDARQVAEGSLNFRNLSLMTEFRELIEKPRLTSVYQPLIDLRSGQIMGWEALARGPRESHFAKPDIIFNFAEEVGRLFHIERTCRESAIRGLGGLGPGQKLFLNIHPRTMSDPSFKSGETRRLLERYGLTPENVVFEITERHTIRNFALFHRTLDHYRSQGYLVAVDDAGTGYSGLDRIATLRPEFIKVDMSLIRGVEANPVQQALIETMVSFADRIGSQIVAEGIETETELSSLIAMGVHYGQGFFLARPAAPKPSPEIRLPFKVEYRDSRLGEWKCSIPISDLAESVTRLAPTAKVQEVKAILDSNPIGGAVVVQDGRPLGLVMSHILDRQLGTYYGTALYYNRSVSRVMDTAPLIVEGSTPVEQVARRATNRERFKKYDHIVVVENGLLLGVVSVQKMLDALARVQVEVAKGANPLTGLPGGVALEREIERCCSSENPASFIYVDLDNFKIYNDTYGFESGDKMLRLLSNLLTWAARRHGGPDAFVGHIGGDDFVVILRPDKAERFCLSVIRCFKRLVLGMYNPADRERGHVIAKDRYDRSGEFPLVSVSLGIVDCVGYCGLGLIAQRAAEIKHLAKSKSGNVYVRDRRAPLGGKPDEDDFAA